MPTPRAGRDDAPDRIPVLLLVEGHSPTHFETQLIDDAQPVDIAVADRRAIAAVDGPSPRGSRPAGGQQALELAGVLAAVHPGAGRDLTVSNHPRLVEIGRRDDPGSWLALEVDQPVGDVEHDQVEELVVRHGSQGVYGRPSARTPPSGSLGLAVTMSPLLWYTAPNRGSFHGALCWGSPRAPQKGPTRSAREAAARPVPALGGR